MPNGTTGTETLDRMGRPTAYKVGLKAEGAKSRSRSGATQSHPDF